MKNGPRQQYLKVFLNAEISSIANDVLALWNYATSVSYGHLLLDIKLDVSTTYLFMENFLEWSMGGIFTPSFLVRGAKERRGKDLKERCEKRSSLQKIWSVSRSA